MHAWSRGMATSPCRSAADSARNGELELKVAQSVVAQARFPPPAAALIVAAGALTVVVVAAAGL